MSDFKFCPFCQTEKPLGEFYRRGVGRPAGQYQSECKACGRVRRSKWWKSPRGKLSSANTKLKARFGISMEEYSRLLELQEHKCLVCGDSESYMGHRLAVDHDHTTGRIRGLLCKGCNIGLGNFKDDPELLRRAAEYLRVRG